MIKLMLVDDHPMVRQVVRSRLGLEPDLIVIGEAENGEMAVELVPTLKPDIVLMDINMPCMDGITATAALRDIAPGSSIVILSMEDDPLLKNEATEAGASAFVSKYHILDQLVGVIRHVASLRGNGSLGAVSA
jgi:DNA-binding NarL/FixJ family response regulator